MKIEIELNKFRMFQNVNSKYVISINVKTNLILSFIKSGQQSSLKSTSVINLITSFCKIKTSRTLMQ